MANLVLFFALLCFQISRGGVVSEPKALQHVGENVVNPSSDDGRVPIEKPNAEKSAEEEWTEEDEKWFEEIQSLLGEDSDEDYDMNYAEFGKLIQQIEKLMSEHHPEKGGYEWLQEIAKWFYEDYDDDDDDDDDDESDEEVANFYTWIFKKTMESGYKSKRPMQKRFSSV